MCCQSITGQGARGQDQFPLPRRRQWSTRGIGVKVRTAAVRNMAPQASTCGIGLATMAATIAVRDAVPGNVPVVHRDLMFIMQMGMQKGHCCKICFTQVTTQRVTWGVHAMKHQGCQLCGHRTSVAPFERLLAKGTWAFRRKLLGDLGRLDKDAWYQGLMMQPVMAVHLLTFVVPDTTYHAGVGQVGTNVLMLLDSGPLLSLCELRQHRPKGCMCHMKVVSLGLVNCSSPCRRRRWSDFYLAAVSFHMNFEPSP